jgi:hypothetical protein
MTDRFEEKSNGVREQIVEDLDRDLKLALTDFKSSMHAWSDAAYSRQRTWPSAVRRRSWRLALGWAMGCLLVAGSVSGGLYQRHERLQQARIAAAQQAAYQARQLRADRAAKISDENLLADVDSDISRQIPSALEPLAGMMSEYETK